MVLSGKKIRILFLNPKAGDIKIEGAIPSLNIHLLAAHVPKDINVEIDIIDENAQKIPNKTYDLAAMTGMTPNIRFAYRHARRMREQGTKIILGGPHVTALPKEARNYADAVVVGEADIVFPKVIEDFFSGRLDEKYTGAPLQDLSNLKMPRWDLVDTLNFVPLAKIVKFFNWIPGVKVRPRDFILIPVQTRRGCPVGCSFCSVTGAVRFRPDEDIINEISYLKDLGHRSIVLVDDNIGLHPQKTINLVRKFPPDIIWFSQFSINFAFENNLLSVMKESGCEGLYIGLESILGENLKAVGKGDINKPEEYLDRLANIRRHGIRVIPSFIIGLPNDDSGVGIRTAEFAQKAEVPAAVFVPMTPLPGTKLFKEMAAAGQLREGYEQYWLDDRKVSEIVFCHEKLSPGLLMDEVDSAWETFYSRNMIKERIMRQKKSEWMPYIVLNEIFKKMYFQNSRPGTFYDAFRILLSSLFLSAKARYF